MNNEREKNSKTHYSLIATDWVNFTVVVARYYFILVVCFVVYFFHSTFTYLFFAWLPCFVFKMFGCCKLTKTLLNIPVNAECEHVVYWTFTFEYYLCLLIVRPVIFVVAVVCVFLNVLFIPSAIHRIHIIFILLLLLLQAEKNVN